ncbi:MAG: fimbrillin family protein [Alistipes sp.]|nr:fimbrillin family protein [Alistipes sp.]
MKKIFIAVLAVAAFASCSQEHVVVEQPKAAIGFDTFVENSTRANDLTVGNFDFGVYGTVTKGNSALIFNNQEVKKDFTYSPAVYWIAEASYTFGAFAPYTDRAWSYELAGTDSTDKIYAQNGTVTFNNGTAAANQDFIYAYQTATTGDLKAQPAPVTFIFSHMLSKVAFNFTNTFDDDDRTSLKVYNVKINNTALEATMPIVGGVDDVWTAKTENNDLMVAFGEAVANNVALFGNGESFPVAHQYVIPVERTYNITFSVDLYMAGVYLATYNHVINAKIDFAKNGNYSLNVMLSPSTVNPDAQLYPIEFSVERIEDWDNGNTVDTDDPADGEDDVYPLN